VTAPIVHVTSLHRSFRTGKEPLVVLDGLDLSVEPGAIVAIRGRSGSGKTTLLNILGGLDRQYEGRVEVAGRDIGRLDDAALAGFRNEVIGLVFQSFNLIPSLSCAENVMLPAMFSRRRGVNVDRERLDEVLARVDLLEMAEKSPATMSGGQRQRAAIARAVLLGPCVLLCDEPTGNLDVETGASILALFRDLNEKDGMTIIIVTHEERAAVIAHRRLSLVGGRLA
jgi:putative ABC transport system ATP-binding protein